QSWTASRKHSATPSKLPSRRTAPHRAVRSRRMPGRRRIHFQPLAGTVWQDRFINNFVDLDPSSGILDWDCTGFTYDGHQGHDLVLRFFAEQDVGVPIFAALDGVVIARHDGEFDRNNSLNPSAV